MSIALREIEGMEGAGVSSSDVKKTKTKKNTVPSLVVVRRRRIEGGGMRGSMRKEGGV
jgi:hypothetical protein